MGRIYMMIVSFAMMFLSNPTKSWGQDIVKLSHIVQRGETIEILADKYRLTTDILKTVNLGMDTFYTGLEVFIPVDKKYLWLRSEEDSEKVLEDIAGYFSEYQEASRIFNSGDYKTADKLFESTIRNHGKYLPCEEAYFGKAMCDYNRKKWSSAIDGFSQVISIDECPEELREQSRNLKANAEDQREARNQRTANFFSGLFQAAAEVGTAYMAASQASTSQTGYNYPSMPQGANVMNMSNADITNTMNQIANVTIMQFQQQQIQEEIQFKNNFIAMYKRIHGKEPSEDEIQAAYNSQKQMQGNAYKTVQQASSGMYDRELGISGSSSSRETSSSRKCMKLTATDLAHCNGYGVCSKCNGNKKYFENGRWVDPCVICGGSGLCPSCRGKGER